MNDLVINKEFVKAFGPYPDYLAICYKIEKVYVVYKCAPGLGYGDTEESAWEDAANYVFHQLY